MFGMGSKVVRPSLQPARSYQHNKYWHDTTFSNLYHAYDPHVNFSLSQDCSSGRWRIFFVPDSRFFRLQSSCERMLC